MEHFTLLLAALVAAIFILSIAPKVAAPLEENSDSSFSSYYEDSSPPDCSSREDISSD